MGKDWKYIIYLTLIVGVFVAIKLLSPKQYNWSITFSHEDKNPFGTYALNRLLPELTQNGLNNSYRTLYELKDSIKNQEIIFIVASRFNAQKPDVDVLLEKVTNGATAFISSNYFSGALADTLGLTTYDDLFDNDTFIKEDTSALHLTYINSDTVTRFQYRRENIHNYFGRLDSVSSTVLARNDWNKPIAVKLNYGKGNLILNCTPLVFTNIHLLSKNNNEFASALLSYLPLEKVWRTEFYHLGRMEAGSPLRFILNNEPLSWAYYIAIISLLVFMVVEAKRKQRIIPILPPLANSTLEFVGTIGNLYYQKRDHKNIAEKKITFFLEQVRNHYFINTFHRDENFVTTLAKKSGHSLTAVNGLVKLINEISTRQQITAEELKNLNQQLEKFWSKK